MSYFSRYYFDPKSLASMIQRGRSTIVVRSRLWLQSWLVQKGQVSNYVKLTAFDCFYRLLPVRSEDESRNATPQSRDLVSVWIERTLLCLWWMNDLYSGAIQLVGGLEHFFTYWECHNPNWRTHIFQRGRLKPPTRRRSVWWMFYSVKQVTEPPLKLWISWFWGTPKRLIKEKQTRREEEGFLSGFGIVSWYLYIDMGMGQYLLIPFLGEWTSIYQLFWCSPGVPGFWHTAIYI